MVNMYPSFYRRGEWGIKNTRSHLLVGMRPHHSGLLGQRMCNCITLLGQITEIVQFSSSVVSDSLRHHESQHARPPCPSQTPRVYSNWCPLSRWCHPAISSSIVPFSSCPQSLPASGSFPMSQLFAWGGQSIGVSASASVLPLNTQDWSPLGWTSWISLQSLRWLKNSLDGSHMVMLLIL